MDFISKPYPVAEIIQARVRKCVELAETRDMVRQTERDPLTHLFNINYFVHYAELYDQHYPKTPTDAVVFDVCGFQGIIRRNGREYADGLLRQIGGNLRQTARKIGGIGCYRGVDTFQLYCPHQEDYERVLRSVSEGLREKDNTPVALRIGVSADVDKTRSIDERMNEARKAADAVREGR